MICCSFVMSLIFTRPTMFASSAKPPWMENPLSLLWQAINVKEFLEGIDLPMTEGFLEEVQEPSPPPRTPSPLFFQPQSNLPLWLQAPPPLVSITPEMRSVPSSL